MTMTNSPGIDYGGAVNQEMAPGEKERHGEGAGRDHDQHA